MDFFRTRRVRFARRLFITTSLLGFSTATHAQITLDGTLGPAGPLAGPDYAVTAGLGTTSGNNLFHSFGQFDLSSGETATFSGPGIINNILARVTGGMASNIDGTLRSDIAGAKLIFINPAGVIFGPNAILDISGSFAVTTADTLHLADDGHFDATDPAQTVLSSESPSAFGFLNPVPAAVTIDGATLDVDAGNSLSVVGGDSLITGTLNAPSGRVNLVAAASTGQTALDPADTEAGVDITSFSQLGMIRLEDAASVSVNGDPAGSVVIRAGTLILNDGSTISSDNTGATNHAGNAIDFQADEIQLNNARVIATSSGSGRGGDILINTTRLSMDGEGIAAEITTNALSTGNAGNITINTQDLLLQNAAGIGSRIFGIGNGSLIQITATNTVFDGMGFLTQFGPNSIGTGISGASFGRGNGADIRLQADTLTMLEGAVITTAALDQGDAGSIEVTSRELTIDSTDFPATPLRATAIGSPTFLMNNGGAAGDVTIFADNLTITHEGLITSSSFGDGPGGNIQIGAPDQPVTLIQILQGATISTITTDNGDAGGILLYAEDLTVDGLGFIPDRSIGRNTGISASTFSSDEGGQGGDIELHINHITLINRAGIISDTFGSGGGGNLLITSPEVDVVTKSIIAATTFGAGTGGNVDLSATSILLDGGGEPLDDPLQGEPFGPPIPIPRPDGDMEMLIGQANTAIVTASLGPGASGDVTVRTSNLIIRDVASIAVGSFNTGDGGNATIIADHIEVSRGANPFASGIFATAFFLGQAGSLDIRADSIEITDGGLISADSFGPTPGGDIDIVTGTLTLTNQPSGRLTLVATQTHGDQPSATGGNLSITADKVVVDQGSAISAASFGAGPGGNIVLNTDSLTLSELGTIRSTGTGLGRAGELTITVGGSAKLLKGGALTSSSTLSSAGLISLTVGGNLTLKDSSITAQALDNGGNVQLEVANRVRLINSLITAEAGGDGGNILIGQGAVVLDDSRIIANAVQGAGGDINILTNVFLTTPDSIISASSELGVTGTITISSPDTNLAASLATLPESLAATRPTVTDHCAEATTAAPSTFTIRSRGASPSEPEGWLPTYEFFSNQE